eukprot:jgi/Ulvmu1/3686/UM017_0102.1
MLPAILSHRKEAFEDPESFWNSPAGRELNARCGNKFDETSIKADEFAVLVSLGADGGQLFVNKQHGALIWGIRLQELHDGMAAKNDTWAPLGVVEGPTEPNRLDSVLESLEDFFLAHDPGRDGTTPIIVEIWEDPADPNSNKRLVKLWPVCGWAEGDIPVLEKLANAVGHGAKSACVRCAFLGATVKDANTVRCVTPVWPLTGTIPLAGVVVIQWTAA